MSRRSLIEYGESSAQSVLVSRGTAVVRLYKVVIEIVKQAPIVRPINLRLRVS